MAGVLRFRYAIAILVMLTLWAGLPVGASAQSESTLHDRIERGREHERVLSGAVARLSTLISRTGREITIVQGRLDDVQADLVAARARVERTQAELRAERIKLLRLRRRFAEDRAVLASQLVAMYKSDPPDVVSLVLGSHSFADLLDRVVFVKRVTERNAAVVERVRTERGQTQRQTTLLARLEDKRRDEADAVQRRQNALVLDPARHDVVADHPLTLDGVVAHSVSGPAAGSAASGANTASVGSGTSPGPWPGEASSESLSHSVP